MDTQDLNKKSFLQIKRNFSKQSGLAQVPSNSEILRVYYDMVKKKEIESSASFEALLQKRGIRSESGIIPVQVLTKPFRCPGKCIFCPNDFTMPKSYINTEPGAMRALLNNFDPLKQVQNRLLSLTLTGHKTDKIEMIVLGGTRDVYPDDYKVSFIKGLYDACNTFPQFYDSVKFDQDKKYGHTVSDDLKLSISQDIDSAKKINETADCRIIGLTVETRPEYVTDENCKLRRELGITRLEMGLQSLYDDVLDMNKRGHSVQQARDAVHKLRQYGFKISIHMMPGLYGSTYEKDLSSFEILYSDPYLKPDEIKFYPTSVIPNTELYDLYLSGEYKPLDTETITKLIREAFLNIIPPYTRIKRLIRDIPSTEIVAGSNITNLSQLTHNQLKKELKNTKTIRSLYKRLYDSYLYYEDIDSFLQDLSLKYLKKVSHSANDVVTVKPLVSMGSSVSTACHSGLDPESNKNISINKNSNIFKKLFSAISSLFRFHKDNCVPIKTYIIGGKPDIKSYRNFVCLDTRSREIRNKFEKYNGLPESDHVAQVANLVIRQYRSTVGKEYFISFEDELGYLYGLLRLLLPDDEYAIDFPGLGKGTAIVRELHVYGQLASIGNKKISSSDKISQHKGFGTQLMQVAELISSHSQYQKLSVISGIGVKQYYHKLGYKDDGTYVSKNLV